MWVSCVCVCGYQHESFQTTHQLSIHGKEPTDIANFIGLELEIGSYHPNQVDSIPCSYIDFFCCWFYFSTTNWKQQRRATAGGKCGNAQNVKTARSHIGQQVKWTTFNKFILYMGKCQLLKIWNVTTALAPIEAICLFTCSLILLRKIRFAIKYYYKCLETY